MQSITILLQQNADGQTTVQHYVGGKIPPGAAAQACRFVATQFDGLAIEAEVQRRLAEVTDIASATEEES